MYDVDEALDRLIAMSHDPRCDGNFMASALATELQKLHEWLSAGGYRPKAWAGKGVDLSRGVDPELDHAVQELQDMLSGQRTLLHTTSPTLIVSSNTLNGRSDMVVACLATHYGESNTAVDAVRQLQAQLRSALERKGSG